MFPLKIVLYTICTLSLIWGVIVFTGPTIIKQIITSYSNGHVVASNVTITPNLSIKIARLDYNFEGREDRLGQKGFSRSISVFWSILGDRPFINMQIGPTFLKNAFGADGLAIYTPPLSKIDFTKILFTSEIYNLDVQAAAKIDLINFDAFYLPKQASFDDIFLQMNHVEFITHNLLELKNLEASTGKIDLSVPFDQQEITVAVSAERLKNSKPKILLSASEGLVNIFGGQIGFDFQLTDLLFSPLNNALKRVSASGFYSKMGQLKSAKFEILDKLGRVSDGQLPQNILEILHIEDGKYDLKFLAEIQPIELAFGNNFIGKLPANNVEIEVHIDSLQSNAKATSEIIFQNSEIPRIDGIGEVSFQLDGSAKIFECLIVDCELTSMNMNYKMDAGGQWVSGVSSCLKPPCAVRSMRHKFITSNTKEIFEKLSRSKILNPFYTAYLYTLVNAAKKIQNGHEIIIN